MQRKVVNFLTDYWFIVLGELGADQCKKRRTILESVRMILPQLVQWRRKMLWFVKGGSTKRGCRDQACVADCRM